MIHFERFLPPMFSLFVSALLVSTPTFADDWPQYRGTFGDGKSAESIETTQPKVRWKVPTNLGFSSFSVAKGRAFTLVVVDGLETLLALDAKPGDKLWSVALGSSEYDHKGGNAGARDNSGGDGPRSTPSTDGEHVYVFDAHLVLTCFNAGDGELVWKRDITAEYDGRNIKWFNAISPVLDGNQVYVGGGGEGRSFLAFEKTTGELIWKSGDEKITHATPAVTTIDGRKQVIYFTQAGLVSVDAGTGEEVWRRKFNFAVSTAASPIPDGNLVYCSAGYGVGAGLFQVDGSEAQKVWVKPNKLMNHWSTPVVHDGHLYGIFEFKKYGKAPLNCVELKTGEIKWSKRGFGPGNCILVGDKLVVLSDKGELIVVKATPDEYEEVLRTDVLDGKCWSTPAYSDGMAYIRSTVEGACVQLSPSRE